MKSKWIGFCGLALSVVALLGTGCATPALVKSTAARYWSPSGAPERFLATTSEGRYGVIVVFPQSCSVKDRVKNRSVAWDPQDGAAGVVAGKSALHQFTNGCDLAVPMPVYSPETVPANATSSPPGYVVLNKSGFEFAVHLDGVPEGPFALPGSPEPCRAGLRAAAMPLAIVADAAIISAVVIGAAGSGMATFSISP